MTSKYFFLLPVTSDFLCGNNVSHKATFLFSDEWPVVAIRLHEPRNTKSLVTLLWHWNVLKKKKKNYNQGSITSDYSTHTQNGLQLDDVRPTLNKDKFPSPSATPNLLPCCENRTLVTFANVPAARGSATV